MKVGTVDLGRAARLPIKGHDQRDQDDFVAMDGTCRVRDIGPDEEFRQYKIKHVSKAKTDDLRAFLKNTAEYKKNTFTLEDDYGSTWTVRYWGKRVPWTESLGRMFEVDLLFRVENVAT